MCEGANLHPGLNHIQWSVSKDTGGTGESSKQPGDQGVDDFVGVVTLKRDKKRSV